MCIRDRSIAIGSGDGRPQIISKIAVVVVAAVVIENYVLTTVITFMTTTMILMCTVLYKDAALSTKCSWAKLCFVDADIVVNHCCTHARSVPQTLPFLMYLNMTVK